MPRLLATGDWHIGAGAENGRRPGDRLRDQRDVALRIADLALDERVDGVLLAGDLLEGPTMLPEHLEVITAFLERLRDRVPVLATLGNGRHDLALRETNGLAIFEHVPGIDVYAQPRWVEFAGCAVALLPWVSPARLVAARGGGDRDEINAEVAQLLVDAAGGLLNQIRVRAASTLPAVLLAHWSVSGSSLPNGLPVADLREPVIPLPELEQLGFDAVVLGHIHQPQMLGADAVPPALGTLGAQQHVRARPIFYVGSPLPLNFGEAASAHGVWILDLPCGSSSMAASHELPPGTEHRSSLNGGAGSTPASRFIPVESRPFRTVELDFAALDADGVDAVREFDGVLTADAWPDVDGAVVRVRYRATSEQARALDVGALRRAILDAGAHVVKLQPEIVRVDRARVEGLDEGLDELAALDLYVEANQIEAGLAERMRERTRGYLEAVGS